MADWTAILTQIDLLLVDPQTIRYKSFSIDGKQFQFNSLTELMQYRQWVEAQASKASGSNLGKVSFRGRVTQ